MTENKLLELSRMDDPVLRRRCAAMGKPSAADRQFLGDMLYTMYAHKGVGLAAPQVGFAKRMIVVDVGEGPFCLINPRIVNREGVSECMEEGCLSLPGINVEVRRCRKVTVTALDGNGREVTCETEGLLARVLQHEIDHLDGKLITDYLSWTGRMKLKMKVKQKI